MSNLSRWILLPFTLTLFLGSSLAHAQSQIPGDPIIMTLEGDLWAWEGSDQPMTRLTDWGHNGPPVLSPDGTRVAYTSFATVFVDWLATISGTGGYWPPTNIWMLDIPSRQTYRIADQPANAVWTGPNDPGNYIVRSSPGWSPDGQQLAWVETISDTSLFTDGVQSSTAQVVIYNLVARTKTVIDSFTLQNPISTTDRMNVSWGRPGLIVSAALPEAILPWDSRMYDMSGNRIAEFTSGESLFGAWLQDGEDDYIFRVNSPDRRVNWRTGQEETINGSVEMFSLMTPDGASLFYSNETWYAAFPQQAPVALGTRIRPYGVSRDGQAVLYGRWEIDPTRDVFAYTVLLHTPDQVIEMGRYNNVFPVWGQTGWRVRSG